jgi:peptide/nickel transport system ATP-binding protein
MIFQEPMSSLNPVYAIGAQIAEAIRVHNPMPAKAALAKAKALLEEVQSRKPKRGSSNIRISSPAASVSAS